MKKMTTKADLARLAVAIGCAFALGGRLLQEDTRLIVALAALSVAAGASDMLPLLGLWLVAPRSSPWPLPFSYAVALFVALPVAFLGLVRRVPFRLGDTLGLLAYLALLASAGQSSVPSAVAAPLVWLVQLVHVACVRTRTAPHAYRVSLLCGWLLWLDGCSATLAVLLALPALLYISWLVGRHLAPAAADHLLPRTVYDMPTTTATATATPPDQSDESTEPHVDPPVRSCNSHYVKIRHVSLGAANSQPG